MTRPGCEVRRRSDEPRAQEWAVKRSIVEQSVLEGYQREPPTHFWTDFPIDHHRKRAGDDINLEPAWRYTVVVMEGQIDDRMVVST